MINGEYIQHSNKFQLDYTSRTKSTELSRKGEF